MFKTAAAAVEAPVVFRDETPVPLSVIALDLAAPEFGWVAYLTGRGIAVVEDDLGRPSIPRAAARMLFDEHRANELRKAEVRAESERRAVEADQRFRASLGHGVKIPKEKAYACGFDEVERDHPPAAAYGAGLVAAH